MEFEDILKEVGDFGRFQKLLVMLFGLSISLTAPFPGMSLMFMVMAPDHRCRMPQVFNVSDTYEGHLVQFTNSSSCRISALYTSLENGTYVNTTKDMDCAYGWEYDKTYFESTAATKWDMVCENDHYPSLVLTLQNVGALVGTLFYGALADKFGRKWTFFGLVILSSITDILSVFVNNLFAFAVLRLINGTVLPTIFVLPYILISEFVSPNKRVLVNGVFNTFWMVGMCFLPLVAYLVRSWVMLGIISSALIAAILTFVRFVPESASWLVSQKRYKEASEVLMSIADMNNKFPTEDDIELKLKELGEKNKLDKNAKKENFFLFMLKYPRLRKHFLILMVNWTSNQIAYMCLQYNVINLDGNVFFNFFLLSLVEFPGNIIFWIMMEKLGRRWSATIGMFAIGLCCLIPVTDLPHTAVISSSLGKLIVSGVYMVTEQQGCELCPTVARSLAIGTGKTVAMFAVLFTPYLAYLSSYGKNIPFVSISVLSLIAAVLSSFLPETLDENLPQSFLDAENFGLQQKYFSFNRKKRKSNKESIETSRTACSEKEQPLLLKERKEESNNIPDIC